LGINDCYKGNRCRRNGAIDGHKLSNLEPKHASSLTRRKGSHSLSERESADPEYIPFKIT